MLGTPSSQRLPRHLTAAGSSTGLLGTEELVGGFEPPEVHDLDKHIRMDHITATGQLLHPVLFVSRAVGHVFLPVISNAFAVYSMALLKPSPESSTADSGINHLQH